MKILCILTCVLGILSPTAVDSICNADLGLVVDITKSLKPQTVPVMKKALEYLVQKFNISEDKTHVSLETFHQKAKIHNSFNDSHFWSVNDVIGLINDTITTDLKRGTLLDIALERANHGMFTEANGDRSGELSALVLFTDGKSSDKTDNDTIASSIEDFKNKGVIVIAVGIGDKSQKEENQDMLNQIAGKKVINLHKYDSLDKAMDAVVDLVCICKPNLGLMVDTTYSLGKEKDVLPVLRKALAHLVQKFDISRDKTHVSLETFHRRATVHNTFSNSHFWSVNAVIQLINNTVIDLKSPTHLDCALDKANDKMFTNGYRSGVKKVLVVFTDGREQRSPKCDNLQSSIEDLKNNDILLIAVAIGPDQDKHKETLTQIAAGEAKNVFYVPDFVHDDDAMKDALNDVYDLICGLPRTGRASAIA